VTARKPNNLPWIALGSLCGLAVLGLFGYSVYVGAKSVTDEVSVTIPDMPDALERSGLNGKLTISVSGDDEIIFGDAVFEDVAELQTHLLSRDKAELKQTLFILAINEDASHKSLVSMKDMLDGLGVESRILIQRKDTK